MSDKIRNEYNPETVTHPGATLSEALEERGMSQVELSERTGRPRKTINEIVKGQTAITPETAIQLERVLGIPATFWNNRQRCFDESVARAQSMERLRGHIDWLDHFPLSQMTKLGWIEKKPSRVLQLDALLSFFGLGSPDEWQRVYRVPWVETAFRDSKAFSTDSYALSAWLRKGEIEAGSMECAPFDRSRLRKALDEIRMMIRGTPADFRTSIKGKCAASGVAVVFVPLIKGVHALGATRWIAATRAMLMLSLRGRLEDVFWFTFFHESAHILFSSKREVFVEGIGSSTHGEDEKRADVFASDFLIPESAWRRFTSGRNAYTADSISAFAEEVSISPAIVIGRLQHDKLIPPNTHLNGMRRRIDSLFPEIM